MTDDAKNLAFKFSTGELILKGRIYKLIVLLLTGTASVLSEL